MDAERLREWCRRWGEMPGDDWIHPEARALLAALDVAEAARAYDDANDVLAPLKPLIASVAAFRRAMEDDDGR